MFEKLTSETLRKLTEKQGLSMSMYMPTFKAGPEVQQNSIRFKNLLSQGEDALVERGMRRPDVEAFLKPLRSLLSDKVFWEHQNEGLAVFRTEDDLLTYRLPHHFKSRVLVEEKLYLTPLFKAAQDEKRFYILALSQNEVRLLEATSVDVATVALENVPLSLEEALKYDESEKQLQMRSQGDGYGRAAIFHGHGASDDKKDDILRYFHLIDEGLSDFLNDKSEPLILAGVDYLHAIYREANSYNRLLDKGVEGNPDYLKAEDIHVKALPMLNPYFTEEERKAIKQFSALSGTGKTATEITEIVKAAYYGQIETLFVRSGFVQYGKLDDDTKEASLETDNTPDNVDLVNVAAVETYAKNGAVFILEEDAMPLQTSIAAILRY